MQKIYINKNMTKIKNRMLTEQPITTTTYQFKQLGSDHTAVHLTVSRSPISIDTLPTLDESKSNWKLFKSTLENQPFPNVENVNKDNLDIIKTNVL